MADEKERIFQAAVETIDLASVPKLGGMTRKTDDIGRHLANGGKEGGPCILVQSARKTDYRVEQAYDLFKCLPDKKRGVALIFASYCNPWMLAEYPGLLREIVTAGVLPTDNNDWQWERSKSREAGGYCKRFWQIAAARRVVRRVA